MHEQKIHDYRQRGSVSARRAPMSSESDEDWQGQPADKEAEKQERIKAKNRRAQKRYREKKLHETDQYKLQASMHNTPLQC